jgi:hypothetical protein
MSTSGGESELEVASRWAIALADGVRERTSVTPSSNARPCPSTGKTTGPCPGYWNHTGSPAADPILCPTPIGTSCTYRQLTGSDYRSYIPGAVAY